MRHASTIVACLVLLSHAAAQSDSKPTAVPQRKLEMRSAARLDLGDDLAREEVRLLAWLALGDHRQRVQEQPTSIHEFNARRPEQGGPCTGKVLWYPHVLGDGVAYADYNSPDMRVVPLFDPARLAPPAGKAAGKTDGKAAAGRSRAVELVAVDAGDCFTEKDLDPKELRIAPGESGPALYYRIRADRAPDYGAWTEKNIGRHAPIVIDGLIMSAPVFMGRVTDAGVITGHFSEKEQSDLLDGLRRAIVADASAVAPTAPAEKRADATVDAARAADKKIAALREQAAAGVVRPSQLSTLQGKDATVLGILLPLEERGGERRFLLIDSLTEAAFGATPSAAQVVSVQADNIELKHGFALARARGTVQPAGEGRWLRLEGAQISLID